MRCVFADTSFYAAVIGVRDKHHQQAMDFIRDYHGKILTTDFIIVELGNFLSRTPDRSFFRRL
jgi:predicted nucleic acid-binding protein